jgi:putative SOS response-associated peptidase YedK
MFMCGRYFIETDAEEIVIKEILDQVSEKHKGTAELDDMRTGEIFPTNIVPVLTQNEPQLMKWGFPRFDGKGQIINARLETAAEKPMFRKSFDAMRCLVPASYYFEWETLGTKKQKYAIGTNEPIFMAGLYKFDSLLQLPQFVILTRPAAQGIAFIHERMPVILPRDIHNKWLSSGAILTQEILTDSTQQLIYSNA